MPSSSFVTHEGEFLTSQDQSTQTEWIYESKMGMGPRSPHPPRGQAPGVLGRHGLAGVPWRWSIEARALPVRLMMHTASWAILSL